jgi:hypothetical protein
MLSDAAARNWAPTCAGVTIAGAVVTRDSSFPEGRPFAGLADTAIATAC